MSTQQKVENFISDKMSEIAEKQDIKHLLPGTLPFVTISSQSGAGGNQLAANLIDLISKQDSDIDAFKGWRIFDKNMCQHLLEQDHLANSVDELLNEKYHSQINEFIMGIFGDRGMQNVAYARLARQLRMLASIGKVVIVGHGGSMATRSLAGGTHIRLVAQMPVRTARMAAMLGVDENEAVRLIKRRDSDNRNLVKTHYQVDIDEPENYHFTCNTEWIPPNVVADFVMSIFHKKLD